MEKDKEDWMKILLPYLPLLDDLAHEVHLHLHRFDHLHQGDKEKADSSELEPIKKNNYGYFTCK